MLHDGPVEALDIFYVRCMLTRAVAGNGKNGRLRAQPFVKRRARGGRGLAAGQISKCPRTNGTASLGVTDIPADVRCFSARRFCGCKRSRGRCLAGSSRDSCVRDSLPPRPSLCLSVSLGIH